MNIYDEAIVRESIARDAKSALMMKSEQGLEFDPSRAEQLVTNETVKMKALRSAYYAAVSPLAFSILAMVECGLSEREVCDRMREMMPSYGFQHTDVMAALTELCVDDMVRKYYDANGYAYYKCTYEVVPEVKA